MDCGVGGTLNSAVSGDMSFKGDFLAADGVRLTELDRRDDTLGRLGRCLVRVEGYCLEFFTGVPPIGLVMLPLRLGVRMLPLA